MNRPPVIVVKLGGSLYRSEELEAWLATISREGRGRLVLVPGGGPFADAVREAQTHWGFDDSTAHHLAILAMEQYGRMLAGLNEHLVPCDESAAIQQALEREEIPVWMPARLTIGRPEIPESWEVTSDSLALWLADWIGAKRVVLIKAKAPPEGSVPCTDLAAQELVDPAFDGFLSRSQARACCLGPGEQEGLVKLLSDDWSAACEILRAL